MVNATARPLYCLEVTAQEAVKAPRAGVERGEKSRLHRDSIPDRQASSESLYRLSSSGRGQDSLWAETIPDLPNKEQSHTAVDKVAA